MSYTVVTDAETDAGEPVTQSLFKTKVKGNFDDHETRIASLESSIAQLDPIEFGVFGVLNPPMAVTGALTARISRNITLLAARLLVVTAGSAGTLTVDIEYKRGAGAWTSILSSPMAAVFSSGSYFLVTGTLAVASLLAGDLLRLDINGVQTNMQDFLVYLENKGA